MPSAAQWWWELRLHVEHGTVEVRVPDAQATVADAAAIAGVVHALVAHLAATAGDDAAAAADTWRIEENRWSAARHGVEGALADVVTAERVPTRERLLALLDELGPAARRVGCAAEVERARALVAVNGALRQRRVAAGGGGATAVAADLAGRFLEG